MKVYKVSSMLVTDEYHKLNGEYIYDGEREEVFEPTVHFDNKEKAMSECERILDKYLNRDCKSKKSDIEDRRKNCLLSLERKNYCMFTSYLDNLVIKIKEIPIN